jgi:hypothetical protein
MSKRSFQLLAAAALILLSSQPPADAMVAACGGSRASASTWQFPGTGKRVTAKLWGSVLAEVYTASPTEKSATWVSGRMYGTIQGLGSSVVVRVSPGPESFAEIRSLDPTGTAFYPALAEQTLYWEIDVLDKSGNLLQTLKNLEPMRITAEIHDIPPYGVPFPIEKTVDFYDAQNPAEPVIQVLGGQSFGILEDVGGVDIRQVAQEVDRKSGTFTSTFDIVNTSKGASLDLHWYATGLHGTQLTGISEGKGVRVAGERRITLSGTFDPKSLDSGLVVHATTVPGAVHRAEGRTLLNFN